jgi:hypothetical protein
MRRVLVSLIGLPIAGPAFAQGTGASGFDIVSVIVLAVLCAFVALLWKVISLLRRALPENPHDTAIEVAASAIKAQRRVASSWNEFYAKAKDRADK